uniref:Uncharacterized protein n=1 Tax=Romanomermis culicivorax TaxID=13658 RepID=A0A915KZL1_ROMCU
MSRACGFNCSVGRGVVFRRVVDVVVEIEAVPKREDEEPEFEVRSADVRPNDNKDEEKAEEEEEEEIENGSVSAEVAAEAETDGGPNWKLGRGVADDCNTGKADNIRMGFWVLEILAFSILSALPDFVENDSLDIDDSLEENGDIPGGLEAESRKQEITLLAVLRPKSIFCVGTGSSRPDNGCQASQYLVGSTMMFPRFVFDELTDFSIDDCGCFSVGQSPRLHQYRTKFGAFVVGD